MKNSIPNVSYSAITTFQQCKLRYKFQFIDKMEMDTQPLRIGKVIHEGIHKALVDDLKGSLVDYVRSNLSKEDYVEAKNIVTHETIPTIKTQLIQPLRVDGQEVLSEFEVSFPFKDIKFKGIIDLLIGTNVVIDFKTSKNMDYPDWNQHKFYAFLLSYIYKNIYNKDVPSDFNCILYYIRFNKVSKKIFKIEEIRDFYKDIMNVVEDIFKEVYFSAKINKFCNWCPFNGICETFQWNKK